MKKLSALLLCLIFSTFAKAQVPSDASISRLLEVMEAEKMVAGIATQIDAMLVPLMEQSLEKSNLSASEAAEVRKSFQAYAARAREIMAEEISWKVMKSISVQTYKESFSQTEVDGMIAFYETPVGKAVIQKMPVVVGKSMKLTQERMGPMMQKIQALSMEFAKK
jgi:uncharacterized protein